MTTTDKFRTIGGKGDKEFESARDELLGKRQASLAEEVDLQTDAFLDIPDETMKACTGDELQMLSKLFELDIDVQAKAVQGLVDYMSDVVGKATALMSGLDLSKLEAAIAAYKQTHTKEKKVEPKVAAGKVNADVDDNRDVENAFTKVLLSIRPLPIDDEKQEKILGTIKEYGKAQRAYGELEGFREGYDKGINSPRYGQPKTEKKTAAYEGKVMMQDHLLNGITYQQLADTVNANEIEKNEKAVIKTFNAMLAETTANAREDLRDHMAEIIEAATDIEK